VFKGRHFDRSVILLCVRWYLAYNLSLRKLDERMQDEESLSIMPRSIAGQCTTRLNCWSASINASDPLARRNRRKS
jgi:hypothetical protein